VHKFHIVADNQELRTAMPALPKQSVSSRRNLVRMTACHVRRDKAFDWAWISLGTRQIGMPFAFSLALALVGF
jgi:hypothetical protein